jgi:hypothetical protein
LVFCGLIDRYLFETLDEVSRTVKVAQNHSTALHGGIEKLFELRSLHLSAFIQLEKLCGFVG